MTVRHDRLQEWLVSVGEAVGGGAWPNSASCLHSLAHEFQRRTLDWCMEACGGVFFGEVSIGV